MQPLDTPPVPGLARRLASLAYELLLLAAVLLAGSALLTPLKAALGEAPWVEQLFRALLAALMFGYFGLCWVRNGQTVAMKTWRIRLERVDGRPVDGWCALIRYVIALLLFVGVPAAAYYALSSRYGASPRLMAVSLLWWLLPLAAALVDRDRQFLHDRMAGTRQVLLPPKRKKG